MWEGSQCPVCNTPMNKKEVFSCYALRDYNIIACPNLVEEKYPHYEQHFKPYIKLPYYESGVIYPYLIESYPNLNSNVYKWNEAKACFSRKVLLDVPYIQIPWNNLEAARDKIKLYLLMS